MKKRRKKTRRGGFLRDLKSPKLNEEWYSLADIIAGNVGESQEVVENCTKVFEEIMATPEADLIKEARGYGYPLADVVDFYLNLHIEDSDPEGYDPKTFEQHRQENIAFFKSVKSWEDFEVVLRTMEDLPPADADAVPLVPVDMFGLIHDKRMILCRDIAIRKNVEEMGEDDVIVLLKLESAREAGGIAIERGASVLKMSPDAFQIFIVELEKRAEKSEKISNELERFRRKIVFDMGG